MSKNSNHLPSPNLLANFLPWTIGLDARYRHWVRYSGLLRLERLDELHSDAFPPYALWVTQVQLTTADAILPGNLAAPER